MKNLVKILLSVFCVFFVNSALADQIKIFEKRIGISSALGIEKKEEQKDWEENKDWNQIQKQIRDEFIAWMKKGEFEKTKITKKEPKIKRNIWNY